MNVRNIPRSEWCSFFKEFSRTHRNELVDVTVLGAKVGAQHEIRQFPLDGIVSDRVSTRISIFFGSLDASSLDHPIDRPTRVWVEQDDGGEELAVAIEAEDGVKTILQVVTTLALGR